MRFGVSGPRPNEDQHMAKMQAPLFVLARFCKTLTTPWQRVGLRGVKHLNPTTLDPKP